MTFSHEYSGVLSISERAINNKMPILIEVGIIHPFGKYHRSLTMFRTSCNKPWCLPILKQDDIQYGQTG